MTNRIDHQQEIKVEKDGWEWISIRDKRDLFRKENRKKISAKNWILKNKAKVVLLNLLLQNLDLKKYRVLQVLMLNGIFRK